jgi:hypothetical protein
MKFAKITRETTTTVVPSLRERADAIEEELCEAVNKFIDDSMVAGVPRSHIESWMWNEVAKLPGDRHNYCRALRWITETTNPETQS